jgi:hypothetical protein
MTGYWSRTTRFSAEAHLDRLDRRIRLSAHGRLARADLPGERQPAPGDSSAAEKLAPRPIPFIHP